MAHFVALNYLVLFQDCMQVTTFCLLFHVNYNSILQTSIPWYRGTKVSLVHYGQLSWRLFPVFYDVIFVFLLFYLCLCKAPNGSLKCALMLA